MKKIFILLGFLLTFGFVGIKTSSAQNISINININTQPAWGPVGYDYVSFYYFPDLNVYYDVNRAVFYIYSGRKWTSHRNLPARYRHYDLHVMYKVVLNDHEPWRNNSLHVRNYAKYKGNRTQVVIRDSRDPRYNQHSSRTNNSNTVKKTTRNSGTSNSRVSTSNRNSSSSSSSRVSNSNSSSRTTTTSTSRTSSTSRSSSSSNGTNNSTRNK